MVPFGLRLCIQGDGGRNRRVGKEGDGGRRDQLEGRRHEVARIAESQCRRIGGLPDDVGARAELPLVHVLGHLVVTRAEIDGHGRNDLPFVLQVIAVQPPGLAAGIED